MFLAADAKLVPGIVAISVGVAGFAEERTACIDEMIRDYVAHRPAVPGSRLIAARPDSTASGYR